MHYRINLIFLSSLLLVSKLSYAQGSLTLYNIFELDKKSTPHSFIGSNNQGYYYLHSADELTRLVKYSPEFSFTKESIVLSESTETKEEYSFGTVKLDDLLISPKLVITDNHQDLTIQIIDTKNLKSITQNQIEIVAISKKERIRVFSLIPSDSNSFSILYSIPNNSEDITSFVLKSFDLSLKEIKSSKFDFNKGIIVDYQLYDNKLFILSCGLKKYPLINPDKKAPDYKYEIFSVDETQLNKIGDVPNDLKWLSLPSLFVTNQSVRIVGLYSQYVFPHGVYFHEIQNDGTVIHSVNPFGSELLDKQLNARKYWKRAANIWIHKKQELRDFKLRSILEFDDSSFLLIAEEIITDYSSTFIFQNLAIIKLGSTGEIEWSEIIKKDNSKSKGVYSSFITASSDDDFLIIYNGNKQNAMDKSTERYNAFKDVDGGISIVRISKSGIAEQSQLATFDQTEGYIIRQDLSGTTLNDKIVLFTENSENSDSKRFMTITKETNR